ncbi:hypothetical protein [Burkholderia anthina]|uniref:hypothetical protein n=1 Tax=Burkholderia anthina TaxID=179879 RepID=UPI00158F5200|nr:hypothetical protein [Burkholderia anthina]
MSTPPTDTTDDFASNVTTRPNRDMLARAFGENQTAVRFLENMAVDIIQTLPGNITIVQERVDANQQMVLMVCASQVSASPAQGVQLSMQADSLVPLPPVPCVPAVMLDAPTYLGEGALRSRIQMEVASFTAQPPGNYQLA